MLFFSIRRGESIKEVYADNLNTRYEGEFMRIDNRENKSSLFVFHLVRPIYNIRSADGLLEYLQAQSTTEALGVKDLKEGWHGALDVMSLPEKQGKLPVTRHEMKAPYVRANDPSLLLSISQDLKTVWHNIRVPELEEVYSIVNREFLRLSTIPEYSLGLTPSRFRGYLYRASSLS